MQVLADKFVVSQAEAVHIQQLEGTEMHRKVAVLYQQQKRHVEGVKIVKDPPRGLDPRWAALEAGI